MKVRGSIADRRQLTVNLLELPTPKQPPTTEPPLPAIGYRLLTIDWSVPQRLAGLQHVGDPVLRLLLAAEREEGLLLQLEQPLLGDQRALGGLPAGDHRGQLLADLPVVLA